MKFFLLATLIVLLAPLNEVLAHPATGIVVDRAENVYFSDPETIWRIDTQGRKSIFREGVRGRHVHELSIDTNDNIYGADISYKPSTKEWISRVDWPGLLSMRNTTSSLQTPADDDS